MRTIALLTLTLVAACTPASTERGAVESTGTVTASATPPPPPTAEPDDGWKELAASYLDARSKKWMESPPRSGQRVNCALSCHTTHPYLFSRPLLGESPIAGELRLALEKRVAFEGPWKEQTPWYGKDGSQKARESLGNEAVLNAVTLALHDRALGRAPTATTLRAVERMWEAQRADGGFDWLDFNLEPWEAGNETWGAAMAALAAGITKSSDPGVAKLKAFLKSRKEPTLHDRLAMLWASTAMAGLIDFDSQTAIFDAVVAKQSAGGTWSNRDLIGSLSEARPDAYATAFATFVLCTADASTSETGTVAPDRTAVGAGLAWLRKNQSPSGAWLTLSANRDSARGARFMSDAATAYAVLALTRCTP